MTKEFNFKNIKIVYNENDFNKKTKIKVNCVLYGGVILTLTLFVLVSSFLNDSPTKFEIFFIGILGSLTLICGAFLASSISNRLAPKHFNFLNWVKRIKSDELEFGEFNGSYIVKVPFESGYRFENLQQFVGSDSKIDVQNTNVDKIKPLFLTVNCLNEKIIMIIENKFVTT